MSSVSSSHIKRYRDIAWLLWKHGRADWVESAGIDKHVKDEFRTEPEGPDALAKDLESLGPTFIKVGQMLASRADLLPPPYLAALARLQDDVEPIPFERIEEVINQELKARPSRAFASIDPTPLAAASLAQVHAATLRDGRHVVIKVQRPDIEDQIRVDFEAFATIARLGAHTTAGQRYRFEDMVEEFRRTIFEELDYRLEAQNLISLKRNLAEFELIHVPKPFIEFSSARVLTMERCDGASVADISPVIFTEVNGHVLADALFEAYLKQILVDGFFHADPHPGNVLLDQRHRLALIDLGMVGRIDQKLRQQLLNLLLAISEGEGDEAAEISQNIGTQSKKFDPEGFRKAVSEMVLKNQHKTVGDIEVGRIVLEIQQTSGDYGLILPSNLALVGKTLMNLDVIGRKLAPAFDPNAAVREHAADLVKRRMRERLSLGHVFQSTLEIGDIAAKLPRRLNDLLTQIGGTGIRLDVDAFDEKTFVRGFQKIANRITSGVIIAALIIGAALIMRVPTSFTLFGYPGLAIILFIAATLGGIALLYQIYIRDREDEND